MVDDGLAAAQASFCDCRETAERGYRPRLHTPIRRYGKGAPREWREESDSGVEGWEKEQTTHRGSMDFFLAESHLSRLLYCYLLTDHGWKGTRV